MTPLKKETSRLEDYLEAIYRLSHDKGYASTVDLSDMLQVKPPTVSTMVGNLAKKGYLVHEPYRGMKLTEKGEKVARSVISRHGIISEFLSLIGVEEVTAHQDTEESSTTFSRSLFTRSQSSSSFFERIRSR